MKLRQNKDKKFADYTVRQGRVRLKAACSGVRVRVKVRARARVRVHL